LERVAEQLMAAGEDDGDASQADPESLISASRGLLDELRRETSIDSAEIQQPAGIYRSARDPSALGNHCIGLLGQLAAVAGRLRQPQLAKQIEELALPLACWVSRRGGELNELGPVVNGAAALANNLKQPSMLAQLYGLLREVCTAVSPQVSQETSSPDPTRPWRVLLLNQAIVATRSHQPVLMEEAFELLTENMPEEAPEFFREGMEQMDALAYPASVRRIMERFYDQWCGQRILH
jgi:hypothetical protein